MKYSEVRTQRKEIEGCEHRRDGGATHMPTQAAGSGEATAAAAEARSVRDATSFTKVAARIFFGYFLAILVIFRVLVVFRAAEGANEAG